MVVTGAVLLAGSGIDKSHESPQGPELQAFLSLRREVEAWFTSLKTKTASVFPTVAPEASPVLRAPGFVSQMYSGVTPAGPPRHPSPARSGLALAGPFNFRRNTE